MSQFRKQAIVLDELSKVPADGQDVTLKKVRIVHVSEEVPMKKKVGKLFKVIVADARAIAEIVLYNSQVLQAFKSLEFKIVTIHHLKARQKDADGIKFGSCRNANVLWGDHRVVVHDLRCTDTTIPMGTGDIPQSWQNDEAHTAELLLLLGKSPSVGTTRSASSMLQTPPSTIFLCPDGCSMPSAATCRKTGRPHAKTCVYCGHAMNPLEPFCIEPTRAGLLCMTVADTDDDKDGESKSEKKRERDPENSL